jgi:hypothetical protein
MPLTGIVCESAKLERKGERVVLPLEACLAHAEAREEDCGFTFEILNSMFAGQARSRRSEHEHVSTTKITSRCPRRVVLEATVDFQRKPSQMYDAFRGTFAHSILEDAMRPNAWGERRLYLEHPFEEGEIISLQPDLVDPDKGILWDYKSKKAVPASHWRTPYPSDTWQLQVNQAGVLQAQWANPAHDPAGFYPAVHKKTVSTATTKRRLYGPNPEWVEGEEVEALKPPSGKFNHLFIVYIDFDSPKILEAKKSPGKGMRWLPDVWTVDQVWDFVEPRYRAIREGLDDPEGHLPPIPDDIHPLAVFDKTSPCSYCDVRDVCVERHVKETYQ